MSIYRDLRIEAVCAAMRNNRDKEGWELADAIVERLDDLDMRHSLEPFKPEVPHIGDERSRRIVETLMRAPIAVIHGVFGVLHNYKVGGPWKSKSPTRPWLYIRVDSRTGAVIAEACADFWKVPGPGNANYLGTGQGLTEAMRLSDERLTSEGWLLVPGITPRDP